MALRKEIEATSGLIQDYVRIAGYTHIIDEKKLVIHLKIYKDEQARGDNKTPALEMTVKIQPDKDGNGGVEVPPKNYADCYAFLKQEDAWSDAEDLL